MDIAMRDMTSQEISYACPEIKGNQALRQKSQFVAKFFLNTCEILNTVASLEII